MKYLNNTIELEVKTYYKGCVCIGFMPCDLPDCEIQSIGETTVSARYGNESFKDLLKQEVFDYINKGGYSDIPC